MFLLAKILRVVLLLSFLFNGHHGLGFEQALLHRRKAQYLPDSVIATKYATNEVECSLYCTRHDACFSVNYKVSGADKGLCELNNNTVSENLAVYDVDFVYIGSLGITNLQEVPKNKASCKELLKTTDSCLQNGAYYLKVNESSQNYQVYCHMTEIPGCGGGGWTLVMKTNGAASTFKYYSSLWTNKESYAVEDGLEGLTEKESKLASYWNTPFNKVCLGMTVNGDRRWMMLDYEASSLYSLIADGKYRKTTAGRQVWKSLIADSSLQPHCNKEGFNRAYSEIKTRIGFCANNQNDCTTPDSVIGFGIRFRSCFVTSQITCGNIAQCSGNDNGEKLTAAFGYIFVQ